MQRNRINLRVETEPMQFMANNRYIQWLLVQGFFTLNLIGVILYTYTAPSLSNSLKLDTIQISTIGGSYFIAYAISQLLIGSSLEAWSPRLMLGITAMTAGIGSLLLSGAQSYEQVFAARILMAVGFGTAMVGVVHVVSQHFNNTYAFMVNLSQGLANGAQTGLGLMTTLPFLQTFRTPFNLIGVALLINSLLFFLLFREAKATPAKGTETDRNKEKTYPSLGVQLSSIARNGQFWIGTVYFLGLFATYIAFADLWNIKFQHDIFKHSESIATTINTSVQGGLAIGGILSGVWANRSGYLLPARTAAWLCLAAMVILYSAPLPQNIATALLLVVGLTLGAAPLGLAVMNAHVPIQAQSLATPILLTIGFAGAGVLMPAIGINLAALPISAFDTYRHGMNWFLVPIAISGVASLLMKPGRQSHG